MRCLSKQPKDVHRFNLLQIEKVNKFHYTWTKDLNKLEKVQILLSTLSPWVHQRKPVKRLTSQNVVV